MPIHEADNKEAINAREQYCNLMEEIKRRIRVISDLLASKHQLDSRTVEEFCYLQLRMIAELIAISCLVAHQDIKEKEFHNLKKRWQADDIISGLDKLHTGFYPRPMVEDRFKNGMHNIANFEGEYLRKEEIKILYDKCGEILHIGNINGLSRNWTRTIDLNKIIEWQRKIVNLLNMHHINLVHEDYEILVMMNTEGMGGAVSCYVLKAVIPLPG